MYTYLYPSLVTVFALILYFVVTIYVGFARAKYKISPPAMAGNPDFERVVRVHENTLEQLILFLPLLWLFSYYSSINYGTILGAIWIVGRILYAWGYYQAPEKRLIGFGLSNLASVFLLIGSLIAIIQKIIMQNTPAM
jgi:uncharacterized membrane protein YecN with MAPEG domain